MISIGCFFLLASCGGGGGGAVNAGPANVGGGYTLEVSGGTYNDGSGPSGLAVLATLRNKDTLGPGLIDAWQITITGPGITQPLTVSYDDGSSSSYQAWWWEGTNPGGGTYTATATNGTTTLHYNFTINAATTLVRPALTNNGTSISWKAVTGAGSYYYRITDGTGMTLPGYANYINAAPLATSYSFDLPTKMSDGSYLIEVYAQTKDRLDLMIDPSPAPALAAQENISVSTMDLVITNGSPGSYNLSAVGGVLYMGQDKGADQYGLVVWSSLLTNASSGTPPAGDWTLKVTGPGISNSAPIVFTYPKTDAHYVYWDFSTLPLAGTYTVTATSLGSSEKPSAQFTITNATAQLPVATGISVTSDSTNYTVSWNTVSGASSYYVNLWTDVWNASLGQYEYTEVAGAWVNGSTLTALIPKNSLTKGTLYDVYVTACILDMTTAKTLPPPTPTQVNMSDNTYATVSFTAQ